MNLALIPARGLSDRIPYKNLIEFHGKPLIEWTISAAMQSGVFDAILVSTEDSRIEHVSKLTGAGVLRRPAELAQSETPTWEVVKHAFAAIKPKLLILLQPTSPLRTAEDICNCIDLFDRSGGDSVISVTQGQDVAAKILFESGGHYGRLRPVTGKRENGAIYGITSYAFAEGHDWYSGVAYGYEMPEDRSVDIDTLKDLEIARRLMARREAA